MVKKKEIKRKRDCFREFRFTMFSKQDKDMVIDYAKKLGLSPNAFIRTLVYKEVINK